MTRLYAKLGLLVCSLLATAALAGPQGGYRLLDLDKLSFSAAKLADNRAAYFPYSDGDEYWLGTAAVNWNVTLIGAGKFRWYWDNHVHGDGTNYQYRAVGWKFQTGMRYDKINLFYDHHSQHILDTSAPREAGKFPLENRYGVEIIFYEKE